MNQILYFLMVTFVLASCSLGQTPTPTSEVFGYSDADAEFLIMRLESLSTGMSDIPLPDDALEQLGIDIEQLEVIDRWIGDCYDGTVYDLSPSYQLIVDRNACFGLRVWIERKDPSG